MQENKVLIVEDEPILNKFLSELLQLYFKQVISAYDGEEALHLYKLNKPDLIITDINLPKLDGLSLIEEIRKQDKETQIIVASAYSDQDKLLKAIELNLVTYLIKPIDRNKLKEAIKSVQKYLEINNNLQLSLLCSFNKETSQLFQNGKEIKLTMNEKKVLHLLIENNNRCVTYEEMSFKIYEYEEYSLNAITSLIKRLRKKLVDNIILTCYNEGYKIKIDNKI